LRIASIQQSELPTSRKERHMSEEQTVTTEVREHVFLIGLNRPGKRNAFNLPMIRALSAAYGAYEDDPALRCAVVFAHGDHFTGGLDLGEVGPQVAAGEKLIEPGQVDFMGLVERRRTKPVVCAVQGWCLTIGIELLLASDIRIAADNTRFAQIEVKRGILPFGGATQRFPQVAGWGNAMRYLLTGDEFDAAQALRMGLVQEVAPAPEVLDRAVALAEAVARQAPLAVQATLETARLGMEQSQEAAVKRLFEQLDRLMKTEDAVEGMMSFAQRREAQFQGR
jgi:enoyl-CoA hydratase/carnithine racemase